MSESNVTASALVSPAIQQKLLILNDRLQEYITGMAPGKAISDKEGEQFQRGLWVGILRFTMDQEPAAFQEMWKVILAAFFEHRKGVFSGEYVHRFRDGPMLPKDLRNFERLVRLAQATCEPASRQIMLKQVDIHTILAGLPSEDVRQKFISFYQI